ncbi:MAG: hypothetical protein QFF03_01635 [Pseudomonadota bacterium]|nr:hypothetical protein [Pseudomonadota bacterium]
MHTTDISEADLLVRYSHRSLWVTLVLIVMLGAGATAALGFPGSAAAGFAQALSMLLPIVIVIALAALRSSAKGARTDPGGPAMQAVLNDELRQDSLKRSYRNAFFAMLVAQPLLALAPTWIALANPLSVMACLTIMSGMAAMLASLLYFDR